MLCVSLYRDTQKGGVASNADGEPEKRRIRAGRYNMFKYDVEIILKKKKRIFKTT